MEGANNLQSIIGALQEQTQEISLRRRQQVQEDEDLLKKLIERLNLHSCSGSHALTPSSLEKEEIKDAYQKAREERDEYKFQLYVSKNKIKELKEELDAVRLNQTQHNISIVSDVSHNNERKSCAYSFRLQPGDTSKKTGELNTTFSETYERELNYLHKTNEKCYEEIRKLKSELMSQEALLEKLNNYEGEITKLKKIAEEKQEKMMDLQIEFDAKLKNCKRDYIAQITALNGRIKELETVRDNLNIDLGAAQEEIRSLQLLSKKPVEVATESCYRAVSNSQQIQKETSQEKYELLNVNTRSEGRVQLQPIENIIEHERPTFVRPSEVPLSNLQQVTVDEVKDFSHGVTRGTKRGQRGVKGSKKESAAAQKQEAKKIKSSDEKKMDPLQNIKDELTDTSSSSTRKGARARTAVNQRKKAADSCTDTSTTSNKQNKKLIVKQETDENVEPLALQISSPSLNGTLENIKLPESSSTPTMKLLKKIQDCSRRPNRRRNK